MSKEQQSGRFRGSGLRYYLIPAYLVAMVLSMLFSGDSGLVQLTQAALQQGGSGPQVLIGADDDNVDNPTIQPPDVPANQSLNNTDVLLGGGANDILIGLLGDDVLIGGPGNDILIGGPEGSGPPNSDIMLGGPGNDVAIWQGGDGSDAFIGGADFDALVFGTMDRDPNNVPVLTGRGLGFPNGLPTANVSGQGGFCTVERPADPAIGYNFLVRFFVRATGALAVTIRVSEVEQVFCTSEAGGEITFADLTADNPEFVVVTPERVELLNGIVATIIR
jgi:RTX calcium-binding nonapeptide repeat (4 copies)